MYYGFFNVSANFQIYINNILAKKFEILIIIYVQDIHIYIKKSS